MSPEVIETMHCRLANSDFGLRSSSVRSKSRSGVEYICVGLANLNVCSAAVGDEGDGRRCRDGRR
jgi:hypothetical protein